MVNLTATPLLQTSLLSVTTRLIMFAGFHSTGPRLAGLSMSTPGPSAPPSDPETPDAAYHPSHDPAATPVVTRLPGMPHEPTPPLSPPMLPVHPPDDDVVPVTPIVVAPIVRERRNSKDDLKPTEIKKRKSACWGWVCCSCTLLAVAILCVASAWLHSPELFGDVGVSAHAQFQTHAKSYASTLHSLINPPSSPSDPTTGPKQV